MVYYTILIIIVIILLLLFVIIEENSRLDVKCKGFWNAMQDAFSDVCVFNPLASSNCNTTIPALFKANERAKRRSYEQRVIEVEHGSFTPLVFAATGGMGPATTTFYKRLHGQHDCQEA